MKKILLVALAVLLPAISAFAAEGKPVSYKSGDETVKGILYTPAGKGPFPALIVIHEWWGLNDWVKEQASNWPTKATPRWRSIFIAERSRPRPMRRTRSCAESRKTAPNATSMPPLNF